MSGLSVSVSASPLSPSRTSEAAWRLALERACIDTDAVTVHFQPIADLARGTVCGYEALARFQGPPAATPDRWFEAAERHGLQGILQARVLDVGLRQRRDLPPNCFLALNVSPTAALLGPVQAAFARAGDLSRVIVELTKHNEIDDYARLRAALAPLREAGAMLAVDDAGSGYNSLHSIMELRPEIVKIDQSLISGLDGDDAKVAVVESLATFASRIDAWVLAEGIERREELEALISLGVPLGQGYALGRPSAEMGDIDGEMSAAIRARGTVRDPRDSAGLAALVETLASLPAGAQPDAVARRFASDAELDHVLLLDEEGRPGALFSRGGDRPLAVLSATLDAAPAEVARQAMARDAEVRFTPIVCCDASGRPIGLVRIERLVGLLAAG